MRHVLMNLTMLYVKNVGSVPSSDYYTKNHNYKPITTTTYRPLRHLINNWPPPQPIDPIQVTESYCT